MSPPEAALGILFFGGAFYVVRPVFAAIAKRIAGDVPRRVSDDHGATEELREEVAALRVELAELAERVDFTERLLAKQQDVARLERPR